MSLLAGCCLEIFVIFDNEFQQRVLINFSQITIRVVPGSKSNFQGSHVMINFSIVLQTIVGRDGNCQSMSVGVEQEDRNEEEVRMSFDILEGRRNLLCSYLHFIRICQRK